MTSCWRDSLRNPVDGSSGNRGPSLNFAVLLLGVGNAKKGDGTTSYYYDQRRFLVIKQTKMEG